MSGDSSAGAYQIADLSPLAGLTNLERLSVTINGVDSLEPLRNLKKLAYLFINGEGAYQDFSPISELMELQTLRLVPHSLFVGAVTERAIDLQENEDVEIGEGTKNEFLDLLLLLAQ